MGRLEILWEAANVGVVDDQELNDLDGLMLGSTALFDSTLAPEASLLGGDEGRPAGRRWPELISPGLELTEQVVEATAPRRSGQLHFSALGHLAALPIIEALATEQDITNAVVTTTRIKQLDLLRTLIATKGDLVDRLMPAAVFHSLALRRRKGLHGVVITSPAGAELSWSDLRDMFDGDDPFERGADNYSEFEAIDGGIPCSRTIIGGDGTYLPCRVVDAPDAYTADLRNDSTIHHVVLGDEVMWGIQILPEEWYEDLTTISPDQRARRVVRIAAAHLLAESESRVTLRSLRKDSGTPTAEQEKAIASIAFLDAVGDRLVAAIGDATDNYARFLRKTAQPEPRA